ncbi:GNAT family N-acetyltransferase [Paenibacillus mendelii]|uniref:GNAT family N-acetyltransferase n=1 Tax=Paenibacillus mendelii TaxID=206163 RepID=A0ABV6JB30_9BACL|nr:GNAT family N-acetyltransferase [Paenibacillus mendelii]MCQ6562986.1 GNAT family N-acetyltransferase [Paenibacillus mendelii]
MKDEVTIQEILSMEPVICEQLAELLIHVVEDGASLGFLSPLGYKDAMKYWEQVIAPDVMVWAAMREGRLVGTIQLHLAMKPNSTHRAEVAKLMVHPSSRRSGIARLLMQAAEDRAKEESRSLLILDTRSGDPSNLLYRSMGYIEAGRIPNYARSSSGELHETVLYYKQTNKPIIDDE